jgi:hydroxyacylglutathione hydrolase
MMLEIIQIPVLNDNYIYLIHDPVSGETAVVDPALAQPVLDVLDEKQWQLTHILNTHHHVDHIGGNLDLKEQTGCNIIGAKNDQHRIPGIDILVEENDQISLGTHQAIIIETPGHTSGHIVFYFTEDSALFCGDTLFAMGCGRLFEGSAEQMWLSLNKLKSLPELTQVYCTHEYTQSNGRFALTVEPNNKALIARMEKVNQQRNHGLATIPSTIEQEKETNPFFRADSPDLQKKLKMQNEPLVEIFTEIRKRKDRF